MVYFFLFIFLLYFEKESIMGVYIFVKNNLQLLIKGALVILMFAPTRTKLTILL